MKSQSPAELDNTGAEPYPEAQIVRLVALLKGLKERYRIPAGNFLGHGDVAPGRKVDPGRYFPWGRLAGAGFGLWCDEQPLTQSPDLSDPLVALQAIGYDVTDAAAALAAFRRHYLGIDADGEASEAERRLLQCLVIARRRQPVPMNQHLFPAPMAFRHSASRSSLTSLDGGSCARQDAVGSPILRRLSSHRRSPRLPT